MKDRKKIILIILAIVFILIIILAIILGMRNNNSNIIDGNNNESMSNNQKTFKKVDNYKEFFSIQNTLNDNKKLSTSYVITELYLNQIGNTKYYFINCSSFESDMFLETINYDNNNYYLLIANNNYYELIRINEEIIDLMVYAKNYDVKIKNINNGQSLKNGETTEENVISIYLTYFKDLLISNPELAYNMLDDTTKKKYSDYNNFYNNIINIYNKLSAKIFAYNKDANNNKNVYHIEDNNRNKIIIYENNIMDFKISY